MRKFIYVAILASVIIVIMSCTSVEKRVKQAATTNYENSIVYNINNFPKDLVMADSYDLREKDLLSNLFDGLVSIDEDGNIVPDLAEKWSVNKDKTQYTFTIRKNAKWSDGKDITAKDFVDFFSNILNKNLNNVYADQLNCIFGIDKYRNNNGSFENVAIKALNQRTLQIRLNYSCDYFLNIMAEPVYSLRKIDDDLLNWRRKYKNIPYSGSFVIDNISDNGDIELNKNKNYWNKDNVKNNNVIIKEFGSSEGALAAFENNTINVFTNPPINEIKNIENISIVPTYGEEALIFNRKKGDILDNNYFRKAISMSIDKKNIVQNILQNRVDAASMYIPYSGTVEYKDLFPKEEEAKEFMEKSKYEYNGIPLKIIYINTVENKKICDSIAKNIEDTFNIDVKAIGYTENEFEEKIKSDDYDIAELNYMGNYYHAIELLGMFQSNSKLNFGGYSNREFDTKILEATFEKDSSERLKELKDAQDILINDTAVIPLYYNNTILCSKSYVKGVYVNKLGNVKLDKAYLTK
ncbi:peptide ABC transporter substrate-binding protein [Clostridium sp. cel8]|uniref:peptide ABC transporter substrate-binding protein n=1 Tax=Clostridium sp. cel8 TaxID=2663123 RepID=UPI0015F6DADD|nr:peptide ABC transporter substrate-binding protein [Clostridium sp. cel8]MBA5850868.1 peptide ABC transporter substrate-binding protein [Clostridium sp. cel8]